MKKETILLKARVKKDRFGDLVPGGGQPVEIPGCKIWPRTSTEDNTAGVSASEGLNVALPSDRYTIFADQQVVARGDTWDIVGPPLWYAGKTKLLVLTRVA